MGWVHIGTHSCHFQCFAVGTHPSQLVSISIIIVIVHGTRKISGEIDGMAAPSQSQPPPFFGRDVDAAPGVAIAARAPTMALM
mmetsp:Transcript_53100/g.59348  ORF Transcript_53100/g.59348 Transcript_53100/m.59348 type:complete len:83 (-) Transcript_53100:110-358(-)